MFAHECENIVEPMITAIGIIGKSAFRILFIIFLLKFCSGYAVDALDVLELHNQVLEVVDVMHI